MDTDVLRHWAGLREHMDRAAWVALLREALDAGVLDARQVDEIVRAVEPEMLAA